MSTTSQCCWCNALLPTAVGPQLVAIKIEMFASYWQKNSHGSGYPAFFFVLGKAAKAQEMQSYQRFQYIVHTVFNTSGTNGPRLLSRAKVGTHSALREKSHTRAHTPKEGAFRMGVVSLLSERSARSPTSPGRVLERHTLPLLGLGWGVLPKNAESLRSSDALMRVAVPRHRGPTGLRDLFATW